MTATLPKTDRQGQIAEQNARLNEAIEQLYKAIRLLEDRLSGVLQSPVAVGTEDVIQTTVPLVPLAARLSDHVTAILTATVLVNSILGRLEL